MLPFFVPRPGLEPGWVAPLVFETSASTDSAIWAISGCKGNTKKRNNKNFGRFFILKSFSKQH